MYIPILCTANYRLSTHSLPLPTTDSPDPPHAMPLFLCTLLPLNMPCTHQMRSNPIHMHRLLTELTRPRPTPMKRLHCKREAITTGPTREPPPSTGSARRRRRYSLRMRRGPLVDVACVRVHDQLAQRAVVRRRDVELALQDREVAAAG